MRARNNGNRVFPFSFCQFDEWKSANVIDSLFETRLLQVKTGKHSRLVTTCALCSIDTDERDRIHHGQAGRREERQSRRGSRRQAEDDPSANSAQQSVRFPGHRRQYVYRKRTTWVITGDVVLACLVFGLIYLLIKPVQRGFYCDDITIQYPFKHDTIPMWLLGIYGGVVPVIIVSFGCAS